MTRNRDLESRLETLADENQQLQERSAGSDELAESLAEIQRLEQKLLQLELVTSRDRADIARGRADLKRTQDDLELQMREPAEMSDTETRLVAMRQHLRERYESEKAEREEKRNRSLGSRISRLLKSVSG